MNQNKVSKKAEKIATYRDKYFTTIEYKYRGCKYEVSYPNDWTCLATLASVQHKDRQAEIDEMLDNPKKEYKGENAQVGFDLFWEYVNQE